ncbi:MAG: hypothetical protein AAF515_00435 [Pseudomonadota bacterium]
MNGRTLIGVVVAAFVAFMWGFVFWAATPLPYNSWHKVDDESAAQSLLAQTFPDSGIYGVPSPQNAPEDMVAKLDQGVWAMVNIDHTPAAPGDPAAMGLGFLHMLVTMLLLAVLLKHMHSNRLRNALLAGLMAAVFSNFGDVVWWNYPIGWKTAIFVYDMGFWLIGGLILNYFMRESAS